MRLLELACGEELENLFDELVKVLSALLQCPVVFVRIHYRLKIDIYYPLSA